MFQAKRICLWALLMATLACARADTESSDAQAFVEWASTHLIAVESLESPLPAANLLSFRAAVGSARVVGLGESRHDTREQLLLKELLARHLLQDLGFRALILEESIPHAESLDRYVRSGEGELPLLLNGLAGWYLWDTEEMLALIEWVRELNQRREPGEQVRIFGMDITAPALGVQRVLSALQDAGIDVELDGTALGLDLQRGDLWPNTWQRYAALSDQRRRELGENYEKLILALKSRRAALVAATSADQYEQTLWLAEVGKMGNDMFSSTSREEGGVIRERGMARAVLRLLDGKIAGEQAIVWAHNLHIARSAFRMPGLAEGELEPMGVRLSEAFGKSYVAVGGSFGEGTFRQDLPPGERSFPPASADVLDGALAELEVPFFVLDLREVNDDSDAARWLGRDREQRAQDAQSVLTPKAAYDLVYFVGHISRSQPTPLALRRFQSVGAQH